MWLTKLLLFYIWLFKETLLIPGLGRLKIHPMVTSYIKIMNMDHENSEPQPAATGTER